MFDVAAFNASLPPFSKLLGIELTVVGHERIVGQMLVRPEFDNKSQVMHGGAIMAFADTLGAMGAVANLKPGEHTTTLESKTNFITYAPVGQIVIGESTPLHRGRATQVWQTRITRPDGRLVAQVTQTQMVLTKRD